MKTNKNNRPDSTSIYHFHKTAISLLLEMQQESIDAASPEKQVWREDWKARLAFEHQLKDDVCDQIESSLFNSNLINFHGENIFVVVADEARVGAA
ncbi:hypothetical protein [Acinetobacter sp. Ac_5812]|uniref:hypothetical protein n=1 Tax=Acinetobacter sp. Ac_5812 TaxID=1848937 RepID=UPI0014901901|nr:hypothetical protein [Acinetobacter sp. Ac_5812]NNP70437.1 hypothetical protein [Acinetobacter sp. Ac_5812]